MFASNIAGLVGPIGESGCEAVLYAYCANATSTTTPSFCVTSMQQLQIRYFRHGIATPDRHERAQERHYAEGGRLDRAANAADARVPSRNLVQPSPRQGERGLSVVQAWRGTERSCRYRSAKPDEYLLWEDILRCSPRQLADVPPWAFSHRHPVRKVRYLGRHGRSRLPR